MARIRRHPHELHRASPGASGCFSLRGARRSGSSAGFTLIEMLVVISIATILAATLMPAYAQSRRTADRIRCANHIRQIGIALVGYLEQNNDRLPELTPINGEPRLYSEGMILTSANGAQVDGLGRLLRCAPMGGFLHDPRLLYCPCHRGEHEYERYEPQINRPWLDPEYGTPAYGNYQYRGHLGADGKPVRRVMDGERLIAADGFRTRADFNHVRGTNRLWGDMHVDWRVDADGILLKTIPSGFSLTNSATVYSDLWTAIESNGISH